MSGVYHSLKAERTHWHENLISFGITDEDFRIIESLKNWVLSRKYHTRRTGQIGAGILLHHIVSQMEVSSNSSTISPKFTYYSAHDGTLLSLFSAMGLVPDTFDVPHYSSHLLFELHQYNGQPYVHIEYSGKPLLTYNNISLTDFKREMTDGLLTEAEYKSFCQEQLQSSVPSDTPIFHSMFYGLFLFSFLLGYFIPKNNQSKSKHQ